MEELFCIGCGAQIQTTDKDVAGFTPQSAPRKGLETGQLYCQRCFRLRHYNEISDVNISDDDFLKLLSIVWERVMPWWSMSLIYLILMVQSFWFALALFQEMMCFWSATNRTFYPSQSRQAKVTQWLTERA